MGLIFSVVVLVAMVCALVDIITRGDWQVKHLPKFGWVLLVILLPLIGTLLWFTLGREYSGFSLPRVQHPATDAGANPPRPAPDARSTEQQLADLEREIEYHRLRAEVERRKREAPEPGE